MKLGALVIVSDRYIGIGIVRSLGRHGIPVWTLHERPETLLFSRYVECSLYWPCCDDEGKIRYLEDLAVRSSLREWVLFGTADTDVKLIGQHHGRLAKHYRLTSPRWTDIAWAYDKKLTYQRASDLNCPYPWTICPSSRTEVERLRCEYPVILKPSVKECDNQFTLDRAWRVNNHRELLARYDEACKLTDPGTILIQEWIPGGVEGRLAFGAICDRGRLLGSIVVRQLRQYPNDFGRASTLVQTVECPQVESASQHLIRSTNYSGCIEVEYKLDTHTGQYNLLDVNPRLWGWHSIGASVGADLPYLLWKLIVSEPEVVPKARNGVRWIRMRDDIRTVFQEIVAGRLTLVQYFKSFRAPIAFSMFALDDPLPVLVRCPYIVLHRIRAWIWR